MIAQTRTRYHTNFSYFVNDEMIGSSLQRYGEPMVNDRVDADRFEQLYGVTVCS